MQESFSLRCGPLPVLLFCIVLCSHSFAQTYCVESGGPDQIVGEKHGYRYELWSQNSKETACITVDDGGAFSGHWDGIENYLARRGLGYDQTKQHGEIGRFTALYNCQYDPEGFIGNSYLSIYGWTIEPLVEYYVIEDWRNWIPSMAGGVVSKGEISANGSIYDIYEITRVNQPSIVGTATFKQYFSIRRNTRTSGTVAISEHFDKWESLGMPLGKLHEVSFVVEGYQSKGSFDFDTLQMIVDHKAVSVGDEFQNTEHFCISLNPASGNVRFDSQMTSDLNLRIYDVLGNIVYTTVATSVNHLIVSGLKGGIYLVHATINNTNYFRKVIVN